MASTTTATTTTTTTTAPRGTPLAVHDCFNCGAPVSLRQATLGKAMLELAAATATPSTCPGLDIGGDCTPLYCIACLERGIADDGHRAELVRLKAFIDGLDALLA